MVRITGAPPTLRALASFISQVYNFIKTANMVSHRVKVSQAWADRLGETRRRIKTRRFVNPQPAPMLRRFRHCIPNTIAEGQAQVRASATDYPQRSQEEARWRRARCRHEAPRCLSKFALQAEDASDGAHQGSSDVGGCVRFEPGETSQQEGG